MEPIPRTLFLELALPQGTEDLAPYKYRPHLKLTWPWISFKKSSYEKHRNNIKLDSLLCLRLPTDCTEIPSVELIEYHCKGAHESQSFYRTISTKQWLRTEVTIFSFEQHVANFHSNVVPREAYLNATCRNHQQSCTRGFILASEISGKNLASQSCGDCALTTTLTKFKTDRNLAISDLSTFSASAMAEVEILTALAPESNGNSDVYKISWRKGIFVRKRFLHDPSINSNRELEVALNVSHPNVVHYVGCSKCVRSEEGGYLFMELLEEDLEVFLNKVAQDDSLRASFLFRVRLGVLLQVAQAMQHLHDMNFMHGDLKPQNIFMSRFESAHSGVQYYLVKVGDFDCAHRVDSTSGAVVGTFSPGIGTLRYTAPEVFRCREDRAVVPKHPRKIDVYSFGVVAYQVLTGITHLYEGLKSTFIKKEVMNDRLRPDFNFEGTLDADLLLYIRKCWSQKPETRPSFPEICDKLSSIINDLDHGLRGKNGTLPNKLQSYNRAAQVSSSPRSELV